MGAVPAADALAAAGAACLGDRVGWVWAESVVAVSADPGVRLFVAQAGGPAGRAVLVIHGGPDWDHSYLREPLDGLAGACRLILPDLRGCGRSTRGLGDDQYTPGAATGDLAVLLDVLGVARAHVLGFSYGGLLAQCLALTAPHRVRSLIIASSSIAPVPPGAFAGWAERDRRVAAEAAAWSDPALPGPALTRAAAIAGAPANVWRPDALPGYLARLQRIRFSAEWARPWRAGTLPSAYCDDAAGRLAGLGIPILLLHGRQDLTFPAALAQQAAALIPPARAVILEEAGHMAHIDQPGPWAQAVSDFLG
jgi:pimeloyl-ACP methyl ester carboxylesterase